MIGFLVAGVALALLFLAGSYLPLQAGVLLFWALALWGALAIRINRQLSLLTRFMIVLYTMPFGVTINYLFKADYLWWYTPASVELQQDRLLLTQMISVGLIGLLGLLSGVRLGQESVRRRQPHDSRMAPVRQRTLPASLFIALLACAVFAVWLMAPPKNLFEAPYASTESGEGIAVTINFNSLGVIGYTLLVLLYIDAERELLSRRRTLKMLLVLAAVCFIVLFLQLLRGDRDCLGLIAALMALYVTRRDEPVAGEANRRHVKTMWRRMRRLIPIGVVIVLIFVALGAVRQSFADSESRSSFDPLEAVVSGWENSTWTALLLTNLSMAGRYRSGELEYLYGHTYVDYALSLPPGVLTHFLGIARPVESNQSPNWWFEGISAGGVHPALVPFRNFGIVGTFGVLGVFGFLIARWDNPTNGRFTYGAVFVSSFNWFWYGDMNIIHGLMAAVLLWVIYQQLVRRQSTSAAIVC